MLEESSFSCSENLAGLKDIIESLGIGPCCLSGSGSAMFCLIEREGKDKAKEYKRKVEGKVDCTSEIVRNNVW
jgi:homoserine kinase